jgi:hypothetical protein
MKRGLIAATFAALAMSGGALADDLTGSWKVSGDVAGNAVEVTCAFAGSGDKATSACGMDETPGPATPVTVEGKTVTWSWDATQAVLTFKGTLESDTAMKGDIEVSGVTGNFTATKQ